MRSATGAPLLVVALLALPFVAGDATTATEQVRVVARAIAAPTPLAAVTTFGDAAVYRVDVAAGAVVVVDAHAAETAPFFLRYHPWSSPETQSPLPSSHQSPILSGAKAAAWRVEVDPAGGVDVRVNVRFHGHAGDRDGTPWPFTLTDVSDGPACAVGVCLP